MSTFPCLLAGLFVTIAVPLHAQSYLQSTENLALDFYQRVLSPVRQPAAACQFEPSCSQFAREAVGEYGPLIGGVLSADRLMRCGHTAHAGDYPMGAIRFYDPAKKNYLFGIGQLWYPSTGAPSHTSPLDSINPAFRLAFALARDHEFDYSIIELLRVELNSTRIEDQLYVSSLMALDLLAKQQPKKALSRTERVEESLLPPERQWHSFLVSYLAADAEGLDAWNAGRCMELVNDTASPLPPDRLTVLQNLSLYSRVKSTEYDKARALTTSSQVLKSIKFVEASGSGSPLLAGIFGAILPGSGYLYSGRSGEAFSAFSFNALLGWGIYSLFTNHNTGSGILLSSIALPFYLGNIAGGYNAVEADNDKARTQQLDRLQQTLKVSFYFSPEFVDECWRQ